MKQARGSGSWKMAGGKIKNEGAGEKLHKQQC